MSESQTAKANHLSYSEECMEFFKKLRVFVKTQVCLLTLSMAGVVRMNKTNFMHKAFQTLNSGFLHIILGLLLITGLSISLGTLCMRKILRIISGIRLALSFKTVG